MTRRLVWRLAAGLMLAAPLAACGKKGPPLPPLVRIPAPPSEVRADRRGPAVDIRLLVPSTNTDNSRPANVQRVDVYALNGVAAAAADDVVERGTRIGSVDVKAPRDPNDTVDEDESDADVETLEGPGLDQGGEAHVRELLNGAVLADDALVRTYVGVGITTRGRRGPMSQPVAVTLGAAPDAPTAPMVTYTETVVTVTWAALPSADGDSPLAYHVYDVSPPPPTPPTPPATPPSDAAAPAGPVRLTEAATDEARFDDKRITWGAERCYAVRAVRRYGELPVEGDASPAGCVVLTDTFPPAPPVGVTAVASEGAVNLIWTPSPEADLAGYHVLRATLPSTTFERLTATPITGSSFTDKVAAGARYAYAIEALDNVGNVSQPSARVEETAR